MALARVRFWALVVLLSALPNIANAQGLQLFGIGPVNRSMGGAATAAPIEAIGALHFNPATLTALDDQLSVGAEVVTPLVDISSSFFGNSGHTNSDSGWMTVPSIGLSWKPLPDGPVTLGFGVFGIAGYSVNYPASTTNPILFPQTPTALTPTPGFGNVYADVSLLQITPTLAYKVTDRLSLAVGPTIMAGRLISTPFPFAAPNDANADGLPTYPTGSGTQFAWGMGFQTGVFWQGERGINLGASFKSPQWFQDFTYHGTNELGQPQDYQASLNYPLIVSLGASYTGIERWLFACDVRYFDWKNSSGMLGKPAGFGPTGQLLGSGWDNTWSTSLGVQFQATEILTLRTGYTYTTSPINGSNAGFNVGSPLILQHTLNAGATVNLTQALAAHLAYTYAPECEVSGPFQAPGGAVPGSNLNYRVSAHAISVGLTAKF